MRNRFDKELASLHDLLIEMGTLSQQAIESAKDALLGQDVEKAARTHEFEREVDEREKEVERRCLKLLLQQQPVASDLRIISTALKIITDLERIADQACDIAELATYMAGQKYIKKLVDIPLMADAATKMVKESIDAFVARDIDLAQRVIACDDTDPGGLGQWGTGHGSADGGQISGAHRRPCHQCGGMGGFLHHRPA